MRAPKHTPGPWEAGAQDRVLTGPFKEEHACWFITGEDGTDEGVTVATLNADATGAQTEANAHLIAAAPDLYEQLNAIWETCASGGSVADDTDWGAVRAAIAKAEGRS